MSLSGMALPLLIVFDLDYTLWPFWVDTHVTPPFTKTSTGTVIDKYHHPVSIYYPDVPKIFTRLKQQGIKIGIASRTGEISGAEQLIKLWGFDKYISYQEIYPADKSVHLSKIKKDSGIDFSDMLFFDDEERNIISAEKIGVTSFYVTACGMSMDYLEEGIKLFQARKAKEKSKAKKAARN